MSTIAPFARPLYVMAKPAGSRCNLACTYCYYLEKAKLYDDPSHNMNEQTLDKFIKDYIQAQTSPHVLFTWHGGEPLLRPISFYKKAIALQKKYAQGRIIENCIQTNGTLLNDEWCTFLKKHHFLVGISIDGEAIWHNNYRQTKNQRPSHNKVLQGIKLLNQYQIPWNAMAVVNAINANYPKEFYHFFKALKCEYLQFTPVVERLMTHSDGRHLASADDINDPNIKLAPFSITAQQWGNFLCEVFDEWIKEDVGKIFIQIFDATLANWVGQEPGLCTLAKTCGHAGVMEYNGDVFSCDHYVFPAYKLGNIHKNSLTQMMYSPFQQQFGQAKYTQLTQQCKNCDFLFACYGECPRNRFIKSIDGQDNHNFLCQGYYHFFQHVAPYMDYMKKELQHQRPPANVMLFAKNIK